MKQAILLLWSLGFCGGVCAQTITVKDRESRAPIEYAALIGESPAAFASTNAGGQADIAEFGKSENISIRALGYKTVTLSFAELERAGFEVLLESSHLNLDEVVVSATRWEQLSANVPSKIVSVSPRAVALQNPQTAADLLAISGKVYIQKSQQGGGSPMIRGFATNRLLYTVDGVRMNTAIFRGGNIQNVINLDPFATESTEVLFGPGSVIYGSDAIGGVMTFQTLTPQLALSDQVLVSGKAVARYASANAEKTGHFDVGAGWKKWAFTSSISAWDYDHLRQGSHGPDEYLKPFYVQRQDGVDRVVSQDDPLLQIPSAYSQVNLMQKLRFRPNAAWDFQYGFHFSETSPYGRYDRHNRRRNGTARYAEWDYGPQSWRMHNISIRHETSTAAFDRMTLRLAQQAFDESRIERSLNSAERNTQFEAVQAWSANLDFVKSAGGKHKLYYGLEYILNDVASGGLLTDISTGTSANGSARYPQAQWYSMAVYVNDQFSLSEKLTLQTGVRYNQFVLDADFDTTFYPFPFSTARLNSGALTGSIGGVFRPSSKWVVSANAGTAFRSPNVDDMGKVFDSEPGAVTVPNPDLKAEYAWNVDLGVAKVFGEALKIDLTAYYTILRNALVRRDYQLNGEDSIVYNGEISRVQAIQNAAVAHVYGIQAGLELRLPAGFGFSSDLNVQTGEEELDDGSTSPARHAAPLFGVTRLTYRAGKLDLQLNWQYQAARSFADLPQEEQAKDEIYAKDANGNNYAPAWYTLNFKAMYQLNERFSVSAGLENLTDRRYRPYSSGISGPGRNFIFALRASF